MFEYKLLKEILSTVDIELVSMDENLITIKDFESGALMYLTIPFEWNNFLHIITTITSNSENKKNMRVINTAIPLIEDNNPHLAFSHITQDETSKNIDLAFIDEENRYKINFDKSSVTYAATHDDGVVEINYEISNQGRALTIKLLGFDRVITDTITFVIDDKEINEEHIGYLKVLKNDRVVYNIKLEGQDLNVYFLALLNKFKSLVLDARSCLDELNSNILPIIDSYYNIDEEFINLVNNSYDKEIINNVYNKYLHKKLRFTK